MYKVLYSDKKGSLPKTLPTLDGEYYPTEQSAYTAMLAHNKDLIFRIAIYKCIDQSYAKYIQCAEYEVSDPKTVVTRTIQKCNDYANY